MISARALPTPRAAFLAAAFALLVVNTLVYLVSGTPSEALDSVAWLVLLALFELETGLGPGGGHPRATTAIRAVRLAAAAALVVALAGYLRDDEWLDVLNLGLWIAVVALLELEVRGPGLVARYRASFSAAAVALYAGLSCVALAWFWLGYRFDAYDAVLWLIAFAALELDVLGLKAKAGGANRAPRPPRSSADEGPASGRDRPR